VKKRIINNNNNNNEEIEPAGARFAGEPCEMAMREGRKGGYAVVSKRGGRKVGSAFRKKNPRGAGRTKNAKPSRHGSVLGAPCERQLWDGA